MGRELTIKELANATGQTVGTVNKQFERKKFRKKRNGMIDPDTPFNKVYINEVTKGAGLYGKITVEKVVNSKSTKGDDPEKPIDTFYIDMDKEKKRLELEFNNRRNELQRMELEKKAGNLLPVDVVEKILVINIQAILKAFKMEQDNINSQYVERLGGNATILAEIRTKQDIIFDRATKKAEKDAMFEIENAISTYQDIRGVGQKK